MERGESFSVSDDGSDDIVQLGGSTGVPRGQLSLVVQEAAAGLAIILQKECLEL